MENTFSTFGEKAVDFIKDAGSLALDSAIAAQPIIGVPAGLLGYETSAARERREDREFKQAQREFALKKMQHYDEDRKASLARQAENDIYTKKMQAYSLNNAQNQKEISDLRKKNAYAIDVKTYTDDEFNRATKKVSDFVKGQIQTFGSAMTNAQKIELYDSSIGQEYRDLCAILKYGSSDNKSYRKIALDISKKYGMSISDDGLNITLKDGKTYPLNEQTRKTIIEYAQKQLSDNAAAIVQRDKARNYIDGDTRWKFIDKLAAAFNHPRNDNKGNLAYARDVFDNLMKGYTELDRSQFMIYGAAKNYLEDGVLTPEEQMKFAPQLEYWAKAFGLKYSITPEGKVNVIGKDGKEVDGKEYFEKAFNEHAITKAFNATIERINNQNIKADEQAKSNAEMQQWYADADAVNGLRLANIDDKEKQKVRTAWAESIMMFNKLKELYPDNIDENILKSRQYFRNIAGDNFVSPFDRDADEIELERSQNNLSSLEGKVSNQRNKVSQVKTTDNDTPLYDTLSLVPNTLPADYSRPITSSNNAEKRKLDSMVEELNKAKGKHNKYQASYDKNVKRFGNYKTYRKRNKKDK